MNRPPAQVKGYDLSVVYISQGITPYAGRPEEGYPIRFDTKFGLYIPLM